MNKTYRTTALRYKFGTVFDNDSGFPNSNTTRAISMNVYNQVAANNLTTSVQCSNGIFDYVNVGSQLDTTQAFFGQEKIASFRESKPGKTYNPTVYGEIFQPSDLPNLIWWFNGDDLLSEFNGMDLPTDRWVNRVTSQNDFVQAGASNLRPTVTLGWNEKPCLLFDGVDDSMTCSFATTSNQDYTFYIFQRYNEFPTPTNVRYTLDNTTLTNTPSFRSEVNNASYPGAIRIYPQGPNGELYVAKSPYAPPFLWFYSQKNGSGLHDVIGAFPYHAGNYVAAATPNISGTAAWRLGAQQAGANYFKGEIYEIVVFQQTHSLGYEIELMKYYFTQKYKLDAFWT